MKNLKRFTRQGGQSIGVFDSGVGGLSILIELKKILPNEDFVFLADQAYVPYGEKTKKQLVNRCLKITDYFIKQHNVKILIIACNTATCAAIDEMRAKYKLPIVGTVPAVKLAAENTKTKTIGIISTPSTSKSEAVQNLIKENCQSIKVFNIGCPNLEDTVEESNLESQKVRQLLLKYLKDIKNSKTDQLVLGCTHYPFLKKAIGKMLGNKVKLLDSGKAIAKRTQTLLKSHNSKNNQKTKGKSVYFTTGNSTKFSKVASSLLKSKIKSKKVNI